MLFPPKASDGEKELDWKCLAKITEQDLGLNTEEDFSAKPKFAVRILLKNAKDEICMIVSQKNNYCQLPGGGIENDESIEAALCRETQEESGFTIKNTKPLGYTSEKRHTGERISYFYVSDADSFIGTEYEADEVAEGFKPEWMDIDMAIAKLKEEGELLAMKPGKSYNGAFANRRDLMLLEFFRNLDSGRGGGIINYKLNERNKNVC